VARRVGHGRWGKGRERLEALVEGYREEGFRGGRFWFGVGVGGAWVEVEDRELGGDGGGVGVRGGVGGGGVGKEFRTGVEMTDVSKGEVIGRVVDNEFEVVESEEKV
jgi:hypothetical protein